MRLKIILFALLSLSLHSTALILKSQASSAILSWGFENVTTSTIPNFNDGGFVYTFDADGYKGEVWISPWSTREQIIYQQKNQGGFPYDQKVFDI